MTKEEAVEFAKTYASKWGIENVSARIEPVYNPRTLEIDCYGLRIDSGAAHVGLRVDEEDIPKGHIEYAVEVLRMRAANA